MPAALALAWAVAVVPAFLEVTAEQPGRVPADGVTAALATAAAGLLAAVRWTQAKGRRLRRADDLQPGRRLPARAGHQPVPRLRRLPADHRADGRSASHRCGRWPSPRIAALLLLNSLDAEALRARQAEQQRQLEAEKKKREAAARQKKR